MKKELSAILTALVITIALVLPYQAGAESSPFVPGKQEKALIPDSEHIVFSLDEKALAMRSIRLELAYINAQLKDPAAFVSRLSLKAPKVNAKEVLKVFKKRKEELTEKLLKYAKQTSAVQKKKGDQYPLLVRPFPPPPRGNDPQRMASASIEDALKDLGWSTKEHATTLSYPCEIREGRITEPDHFARGVLGGDCEGPSECEGGVNYRLADGVLPFWGMMKNEKRDFLYYCFFGQLGFKFPAALCDSFLVWQFQLDAGAGLFSDADHSQVFLDCYTLELEDAYSDLPDVPVVLAGSVLELNDNDPLELIQPIRFSGRINVKQRKESALFVGLFILISASSGETMTEGEYQIFNMIPGFAPGVRYRFEPYEPPT